MVDVQKQFDDVLDFLLEEAQVKLVRVAEEIKTVDPNNKQQISIFVRNSGKEVYDMKNKLASIITWLKKNPGLVNLEGRTHKFYMRIGHGHSFYVVSNLSYHQENLLNLYRRINALSRDDWRKQTPKVAGIKGRTQEALQNLSLDNKKRIEAIFAPIQNNITAWSIKVAKELREDGYALRDFLKEKKREFITGVQAKFKELQTVLGKVVASLGKSYQNVNKENLKKNSDLMLSRLISFEQGLEAKRIDNKLLRRIKKEISIWQRRVQPKVDNLTEKNYNELKEWLLDLSKREEKDFALLSVKAA